MAQQDPRDRLYSILNTVMGWLHGTFGRLTISERQILAYAAKQCCGGAGAKREDAKEREKKEKKDKKKKDKKAWLARQKPDWVVLAVWLQSCSLCQLPRFMDCYSTCVPSSGEERGRGD